VSKGPTKAQLALREAKEWIEASKEELHEREYAVLEARKQLEMHETIYAVLEKALTRQSSEKPVTRKRKPAVAKSSRAQSLATAIAPKAAVTTQSDDDPNEHCRREFDGGFTCNEAADANVHHLRDATGYHPFVSKSPATP
jgi:hypothetical protein